MKMLDEGLNAKYNSKKYVNEKNAGEIGYGIKVGIK